MKYEYIDNEVMTTKIRLVSSAANFIGSYELNRVNFLLNIDENGIHSFEVDKMGKTLITSHMFRKIFIIVFLSVAVKLNGQIIGGFQVMPTA